MIKLIASDIDGTLLPSGSISPAREITDVIQQLEKKGIIFALASGRSYANISKVFPLLKGNTRFISSNGSCMFHKDKVIYATPVCCETELRRMLDTLNTIGCQWIADSPSKSWSEVCFAEQLDDFRQMGMYITSVKDVSALDIPIIKISIYLPDGQIKKMNSPQMKQIHEQYLVVPTCDIFCDVTNSNADKGRGIRMLQKMYGISPDETVVFGNAPNDIPMMEAAAYSYATEDSPSAVLEKARFTIAPPEKDRVLNWLKAQNKAISSAHGEI